MTDQPSKIEIGKEALTKFYNAKLEYSHKQQLHMYLDLDYRTFDNSSRYTNSTIKEVDVYTIAIQENHLNELVEHIGLYFSDIHSSYHNAIYQSSYTGVPEASRAREHYLRKIKAIEDDEALVKNNPSLKKAWDHFQTLKILLKEK
jgi:hypothetical protein